MRGRKRRGRRQVRLQHADGAYLSEREVEFADSEGERPLDFSQMGAVLAHGILTLADPLAGRAR